MFPRPAALALSTGALLILAACGPREHAAETATVESGGWIRPPSITDARRAADGTAVVTGFAASEARVRLAGSDGQAYGATTDPQGRFSVVLPASEAPRLFVVTLDDGGQDVRTPGGLFVPPGNAAGIALLSPGGATTALDGQGVIGALDYDGGGGLIVSGRSEAGKAVSLAVDDRPATGTTARGDGRYSARANGPVSAGPHRLAVVAGARRQALDVTLVGGAAPFDLQATEQGWRLVWTPTEGGAQTTYLITRP